MNTCECCGSGDYVTACATSDGPDLELCPWCATGRCLYGTDCLVGAA